MTAYIGRFAPSPTGLLHLGSLIGELASYLDAKANQGRWLLRMEDLDPPREMPGAAENILSTLQDHGLNWDGEVMWQRLRHPNYQQAIEQLLDSDTVFYCSCSRSKLKANNGIHPGRCRHQRQAPTSPSAIRLQVPDQILGFEDAIQGQYQQHLRHEVGDVILQRKDHLFAYQLAVVVDDAEQQISHVVRGSDLLDSTPRQIWLQHSLGLPTPHYAHFPIIINPQGQKLSKQTFAKPLSDDHCSNLLTALSLLQQPLPPNNLRNSPQDILLWATQHWVMTAIKKTLTIPEPYTLGQ